MQEKPDNCVQKNGKLVSKYWVGDIVFYLKHGNIMEASIIQELV